MDPHEVLEALAQGHYQVTLHAGQRMSQRNVSHADIRCCGKNGKALRQGDGKIKVWGFDLDGEALSLICVEEGGVLIVTVF